MATMDFRGARAKAKKLLAPKRPLDLSASALTDDKLRDNIIRDAEKHSPRFQSAVKKVPQVKYEAEREDGSTEERTYTWDGYGETVRDVARALFGIDEPEIRAKDDVRPESLLGRDVLQHTITQDAFLDSRPYAKMNEAEATYGAMAYADSLRESASGILAEHVKQSDDAREASQAAQSAEEMMERLRQQAKQDVADHGKVQQDTRRSIKHTMKDQAAAGQALAQALQAIQSSGQPIAAAQAAAAAAQAAADAVELVSNLPGTEPGTSQNLSPDMQIELAEKWGKNDQLRKIAKMIGRMYRDMRFKRDTRTKGVPIEPVGITTGNDLQRLLPHELARGFMPALRPLFVNDWSARRLLEYDMSGKMPAGKGPIIVVKDGSGSMGGDPIVWANSLDVCLLMLAKREKREYASVQFGSAGQLKEWRFPANEQTDPDEVLDLASHFFGGGTSTVSGMRKALEIIESHAKFSSADVLLIGDGQDSFREADKAVRDRLNALNVRIHGITIMTGRNPYFEQMCEWHVDVTDLAGANEATDALANNIT